MIELKNKPKDKELEDYILALEDPTAKKLVDIGNQIFPNSEKINLQDRLGEKIKKEQIIATLTTLKEKYKHVYTLDEIKKEMLQFNLKFTSTRQYKGDYSYDYVSKINEFLEANNTQISVNDLQYHFYILTSELTTKNPLIFYKHRESSGEIYFVMIDGDKNYVNPINWLLGYANYSDWTERFSWVLSITLIIGILGSIINIFTPILFGVIIACSAIFGIVLFITLFSYGNINKHEMNDGTNIKTIKELQIS